MSTEALTPLHSEAELIEAFSPIKPRMTPNEAMIEASRCLFCHDAPCTIACPSDIDIPLFIRQIANGNTKGAAKTIFTKNILGKACAYACPTQVLCEGSCVYHGLNEKPIDIGRLQGFASDYAIDNDIRFFEKSHPQHKTVAVIGAGPAGLSCAHELTKLGYEVTVFDASQKPGGLNMYGVAPYKLSNPDVDKEVNYVKSIGFTIQTNKCIDANALPELERQFDAIFLGIGLGQSHRPGLPGEHLDGVEGAAEFIYRLRENNQRIQVGKRVVVVGAGNTAIDAAVESAILGAHVTLVYRRRPIDQNAYDFEVAHAKHIGVNFQYLTSPVEILGNGRVEGLKCILNEVKTTGNSKADISAIAGSEHVIPCDMVLFATGQEKQLAFYQHIQNLSLANGRVVVNAHFQTTNPQYFAGGDCVNGGKEVVNAVAHGRDAAQGIHQWFHESLTAQSKQAEVV